MAPNVGAQGLLPSHRRVLFPGTVEKTPSPQLPSPAPGAAIETLSLKVENGAGAPEGVVAPTLRPVLHPPRVPPMAAAGYCTRFRLVWASALFPAAATTSTSCWWA